jgi:hypothetical protein
MGAVDVICQSIGGTKSFMRQKPINPIAQPFVCLPLKKIKLENSVTKYLVSNKVVDFSCQKKKKLINLQILMAFRSKAKYKKEYLSEAIYEISFF